jgi:uncharacterized membrane protein YesL
LIALLLEGIHQKGLIVFTNTSHKEDKMDTSGFMGGLYRLFDWISKMALLNLLWIFFTVLGLGLFGFFPATAAMFAVMRKWIYGEDDIPVIRTFWTSYKREFIKSNLLGSIISSAGVVLLVDFLFIQNASNESLSLLYAPLLILAFLFFSMTFYVIPMFVHYDMKIGQVIKNSFFVMILNPISTFSMVVGTFGICFALSYAPPIAIIFSGNLIALIVMKFSSKSFDKVHAKSQMFLQEQ